MRQENMDFCKQVQVKGGVMGSEDHPRSGPTLDMCTSAMDLSGINLEASQFSFALK